MKSSVFHSLTMKVAVSGGVGEQVADVEPGGGNGKVRVWFEWSFSHVE